MSHLRPVWAVVPVKDISAGKQRLAGAVPDVVRRELILAMLRDVLGTLAAVSGLAGIVVVTVDADASRIAAAYGATTSTAGATDGHSGAVAAAARILAAQGAAMLTIPGDVPLVQPADIGRILDAYRGGAEFVIVPSHDERGSNAVLCAPADLVQLRFGENSYFPHLAAVRAIGIDPVSINIPRIALDIDQPGDLAQFMKLPDHTRTRSLLLQNDITLNSVMAIQ